VFMDLILPDMNGREVCRQVRQWEAGTRHVPIVALTAYDLPGQPFELVKAGMDDYVFKPYDLRGLTRIIQLYAGGNGQQTADQSAPEQDTLAALAPVLDLQTSLADFAGDVSGYQELLGDFIKALPTRLEKMRQAEADGDMERLGRECHSLKGIAAGLGAMQLSRLASQLNRATSNGQRASAPELLRRIESSMAELRAEVEGFLIL
jgi:CheY-like chemotaxis protein